VTESLADRVRSGSTLGVAILATLSLILDLLRPSWAPAGLRSLPARTRSARLSVTA